MAPQRRIDVVLDSVRRLLRIGAIANLQNLLQKQHPADLGQIFGELHDGERAAAFSILVERQPKLAARPKRSPSSSRRSRPTTPQPSSTTCPRNSRTKSSN
jgi:hypothetical protein